MFWVFLFVYFGNEDSDDLIQSILSFGFNIQVMRLPITIS